ncbi:MAG: glycogen synthase GlgA [Burkholderiales bacterium]
MSRTLRVLFATSECAPLAKVGGLGEVSSALPAALRRAGVDARVLLPGYPGVIEAARGGKELARLTLFEPPFQVRLLEATLPDGVPLIVIDCPRLYLRGGGPYQDEDGQDWPDNPLRFGLLSGVAAVLGGAASPLSWQPRIVHCNDWPAALAPAYLHFAGGARARTVMTIHNLAFQGNFAPDCVAALGLPPASFGIDGLEFHGRMSFLKAGLVFADAVTTVSPNYAREIQSDSFGFGLQGVLRGRGESLCGILNGIDTRVWDPETDPLIASRYGNATLERKRPNKEALQRRFGLEIAADIPLLGAVSRLTHQKGIDLLAEAAPRLVALPAQLAVLGAGDRGLERQLRSVAERYPGKISVVAAYDERLAHSIEAGADLFLMPSRFEPCGLNQMYSQRYGTPPVAHATGGLVDTIVDCNPATLAAGSATGFLFSEPTASALISAVGRALELFADPSRWRALQRAGMARDFGWDAPAREYANLYARFSPAG